MDVGCVLLFVSVCIEYFVCGVCGSNNVSGNSVIQYNETWRLVLTQLWESTVLFNRTNKEPILCYKEGAYEQFEGHFFCPWESSNADETQCCGSDVTGYCCKPTPEQEVDSGLTQEEIISIVVSLVALVLGVLGCLILYSCCCQSRTEEHKGKLLWIRRGKNKEIYLDDEPNKPEHADTELIGFTHQPDSPDKDRRPSNASLIVMDKDNRRLSTSGSIHKNHSRRNSTASTHSEHRKHENNSNTMAVPTINILASTPVDTSDKEW